VAARASAFSFRGKTDDLRAIGEKLSVTTVLEGGGGGRTPGRSARLVAEAIAAREPYLTFWKLPAWKPFWQDPLGAALLRSTGLMRT